MQKIIHLFRHGQTDWNIHRRMQGHTDIPLNEEGRRQALSLQTYFKENSVELFMSSDLVRAQQTAQIANAHLSLPFFTSPEFREARLGELEGLTQAEADAKFGAESWQKWISLNPEDFHFRYPQGESAHETIDRFTAGLKNFCLKHDFQSAGLCTHGLVMRRFLHSLRPEMTELLPIPNCVVYKVEWDPKSHLFSFSL
ncbi:histidine phosphatase family protein [Bdellovibrio sp. 22V]|uniref:histidine phosphatase family protein n=1 Tax=Bdellovibrio TaxID=958 RepID=UPI002543746D|nr:histidine phosphatase family protein [Bdellovibrio sp. 22V]WII71863.1 histidine phosphatase family protein [Bdellovibrio sp. 22V]